MHQKGIKSAVEQHFTGEELAIILETARIALNYAKLCELFAQQLDLADETMRTMREKLNDFMEGDHPQPAGTDNTPAQVSEQPGNEWELFSVVSAGKFTIPKTCPGCGADLTTTGALKEWNWRDTSFLVTMGKRSSDYAVLSNDHDGEEFFPCEVMCAACDYSLASADKRKEVPHEILG